MNKIRLIIIGICLMMATKAFAGDFVCGEGTSISKRISCGKSCSSDVKCIRVTKEQIQSVNKYSIIKDGKLAEMTALEIKTIDDAKKVISDAQKVKMNTLKLKLKELGFTDEEVATLLNSNF